MPTYDYYCEANGCKVEVSHKINDIITTWGELSEKAGIGAGDTPADEPVRKLITSAAVINSSALSNPEPACASGGCCPGGSCGL
jgi:predicted nucleic acid-binding Zn ribbon protein